MKPSITLLGTGGPRPDVSRGATALLAEMRQDVIQDFAGPVLLGHDGLRVAL